jgi:hypothetical protein
LEKRVWWKKGKVLVKRPSESVSRSLSLEKPGSELLDNYCKFVDCSADYVANFALKKMLSRDPEYKKWKAVHTGVSPVRIESGTRKSS